MHDAYVVLRECGSAAWLCLLLALPAFATGVVGLVLLGTKARGAAWVLGSIAAVLGMLALGTGFLGRQYGLARMEGAIAGESVDPATKARIRAEGTREANQCIAVGGATGGLPLVLGAIAMAVGLATRKAAQ